MSENAHPLHPGDRVRVADCVWLVHRNQEGTVKRLDGPTRIWVEFDGGESVFYEWENEKPPLKAVRRIIGVMDEEVKRAEVTVARAEHLVELIEAGDAHTQVTSSSFLQPLQRDEGDNLVTKALELLITQETARIDSIHAGLEDSLGIAPAERPNITGKSGYDTEPDHGKREAHYQVVAGSYDRGLTLDGQPAKIIGSALTHAHVVPSNSLNDNHPYAVYTWEAVALIERHFGGRFHTVGNGTSFPFQEPYEARQTFNNPDYTYEVLGPDGVQGPCWGEQEAKAVADALNRLDTEV